VLHHDLRQDMRQACHAIMQPHNALPGAGYSWPSNIYIITPYNMPHRLCPILEGSVR
jgi:LacI family transcriptional regulator